MLIIVTIRFAKGRKQRGVFKNTFETGERGLRKLQKKEHQYLNYSPNIIRDENGLRLGLAFSTYGRGETAYRIMALTPEGKKLLEGIRRKKRLGINIRVYTRI
jgi:hypothetical protein